MATRHADEQVKTGRALRACMDLLDAADWLQERMSGQLENFDLTLMEFRVLETLHREGPLYQQALSRKFKCSKQSVGFVVKRLIEEGWMRRVSGALARGNIEDGRGAVVVVGEEDLDGNFGPVPSKWVERIKKYWKTFRPRMYVELEESGRLHKVAVKATVAMRMYVTDALESGQNGEMAMEGARERFFFLRREVTPAMRKRAEKKAAKAKAERVPEDVVVRIKEHWRRFLAEGYAEYKRSGVLERKAIEQAIRARDSFLLMRTQKYDEASAWEEVRKHYRFLPEGYGERNSKTETRSSEEESLAADFAENADMAEDRSAKIETRNSAAAAARKVHDATAGRVDGVESIEKMLAGEGQELESEGSNSAGATRPSINTSGRPVVALQLTPVGEALIADVVRKHEKAVKAYMRALEGREQQRLSRLCTKLRKGDVMKFVGEMMMEDVEEGG